MARSRAGRGSTFEGGCLAAHGTLAAPAHGTCLRSRALVLSNSRCRIATAALACLAAVLSALASLGAAGADAADDHLRGAGGAADRSDSFHGQRNRIVRAPGCLHVDDDCDLHGECGVGHAEGGRQLHDPRLAGGQYELSPCAERRSQLRGGQGQPDDHVRATGEPHARGCAFHDQRDRTYQYDDASNLVCVDCGTANEIRYAYNGNNRRVSRTKGTEVTYYVHAANGDLLFEYTPLRSEAIQHFYLHGKRIASKRVTI